MLRLMSRGFCIVILTALNVGQIAHQHYSGAFVVGTLISIVWWGNARRSGETDAPPLAALWYGLGAGLGTMAGMLITRLIYGP